MSTETGAPTAATTDAQTDNFPATIDGPYVPRTIPGATVIEAQAFARTDDGHALRFAGTTPTHIVGVCSPRKARAALAEDYTTAEIDRAFESGEQLHENNAENAWDAVAAAERDEVRAMTDGGRR